MVRPGEEKTYPRTVTGHEVNICNAGIEIVADMPGPGGASHNYLLAYATEEDEAPILCALRFQDGAIAEVGVNGVTHEALLTIVGDRLEAFQSGPYACAENAEALTHIRSALTVLHARTQKRQARGVEGTMTV